MQSNDFVEGVSGWRISAGKIEFYGATTPVTIGNLDAPERTDAEPKPFIVVDGVTYIRQSFIDDAMITKALMT